MLPRALSHDVYPHNGSNLMNQCMHDRAAPPIALAPFACGFTLCGQSTISAYEGGNSAPCRHPAVSPGTVRRESSTGVKPVVGSGLACS